MRTKLFSIIISKKNLLLAIALLSMHFAYAYDVYVDGIFYDLANGKATVTYKDTGYQSYSGDIVIPSQIEYHGVKYSVTSIGEYAFEKCYDLTSVQIPNSVTSIGSMAFDFCTHLTSIEIPASVTSIGRYTFYKCSSLGKLIYNAVECSLDCSTSGFSSWLEGCTNISEVVIGDKVKSLPNYFLQKCSGVTNIEIPNSVTTIGEGAFFRCSGLTDIVIPESVTSIGEKAFYLCSELTSVLMPNSITSLGEGAFKYCENLKSIEIPQGLTTIGEQTFYGCNRLTSIKIPNSITSIGKEAFSGCGMTNIEIPNSVTSIGIHAFLHCSKLTKLVYNAEDCSGEGGCSTYDHWLYGCTNLSEVVIGNKVKSLPNYFLYNCNWLTDIEIPNSVTSIGQGAFYNCTGLSDIKIPSSVTSIGIVAFGGCTGLTKLIYNAEECSGYGFSSSYHWLSGCSNLSEVTIGESVKFIGGNAFYKCSTIETVTTPSLESWTAIEFGNEYSNPTYYAKKLLVNGETIRRLTLPTDITELHSYAFINCEPLVTATCGSEILNVGTNVFSGCTGLQRVSFPALEDFLQINYLDNKSALTYNNAAVIYIDGSPLDFTNIKWPEKIIEIPDYAFYNIVDLKNIDIPQTVISIGKYAFANSGLTKLSLPNALIKFGKSAFSKTDITNVTIPRQITEITDSAFYYCTKLSSISFPEGLQTIGNSAFYYCNLTEAIFPSGLRTIGSKSFYYCDRMSKVSFGSSLQAIGSNAFSSCSGLKDVEIEDVNIWAKVIFENSYSNPIYYARTFRQKEMSEPIRHLELGYINHVSDYAFYNASNLQTIRINNATLGNYSFYGCDYVTDLCIDTDSIGQYAFSKMTSLQNIYSLTRTAPIAPDNAFSKYSDINLYVPQGFVSYYENAENCWWRFLDIYGSDFPGIDTIFAPDYTSGVHEIGTETTVRVYSENSRICVETPNDTDIVAIYNLQGLTLYQGQGCTTKEVTPGIYIVRVNNLTKKLRVN